MDSKSSNDDSDSSDDIVIPPLLSRLLELGLPPEDVFFENLDSGIYDSEIYDSNEEISYEEISYEEISYGETLDMGKISCDICHKEFEEIKEIYKKIKNLNRSWRNCPNQITFRLDKQIVCIFCITQEKGIYCKTCKLKYFYTDSFYPNEECINCYVNSKRGCKLCYEYLHNISHYSKDHPYLCDMCNHGVKKIYTHNKKSIVNRELFIYKKNKKKNE